MPAWLGAPFLVCRRTSQSFPIPRYCYTPVGRGDRGIIIMKALIGFTLLLTAITSWSPANATAAQCSLETPRSAVKRSATTVGAALPPNVTLQCEGGQATTSVDGNNRLSSSNGKDEAQGDSFPKYLDGVAKILGSIAWPFAVVLISLWFKKELSDLLRRLKTFKAGGAEAAFAEGVAVAVDEFVWEAPPKEELPEVSAETFKEATENPRGTILAAWLKVDSAVHRLFYQANLNITSLRPSSTRTRSSYQLMREIQKANLIDPNHIALFNDLRALRNQAAHDPDFNPPSEAVVQFVQLSEELTAALNNALKPV